MPHDIELGNSLQKGILEGDEWSGPWGIIEPVPQSVETVSVHVDGDNGHPSIHYYPYRTIVKWNWEMGEPERLEICAGGGHVTILGKGLRRLAEALNSGQLRLVQLTSPSDTEGEVAIQAIRFED